MPPRSRLYHLAPLGVSTPDVESLTSFIMRLAEAHYVGVGVLFKQEIFQLIQAEAKQNAYLNHVNKTLIEQIQKAMIVGEILTMSADIPSSLSPRDFVDLFDRYARQVTAGNWAAFARFLGLDPAILNELRSQLYRPNLELFVTLILRLGLSAREFLDGKDPKIEFPSQREYQLAPRKSEAIEILKAALTDPSCPSMDDLLRKIGYKHNTSKCEKNF
jgi:TniQ